MTTGFLIVTLLFVVVSVSMVLIILVQRPSGGGLAGAFGGAGGGSDTVFGGRVGDALTWATVVAFVLYMGIAITLNKIESANTASTAAETAPVTIESLDPAAPTGPGEAPTAAPQARPITDPEELRRLREQYEDVPGEPE